MAINRKGDPNRSIRHFKGEYAFLSNFWQSPVKFDGFVYPSLEHAFHAAKTHDPDERELIRRASDPGQAKRLGRKVRLRTDWMRVRIEVMRRLLKRKFEDPDLRNRLISTDPRELIEGNTWHDNFWGVCYCAKCAEAGHGENQLGKLLMQLREEVIREAPEET